MPATPAAARLRLATGGPQIASAPAVDPVDPSAALAWAVELGAVAPLPGRGDTRARWQLLADAASADLAAARVLEPHLDALAILAEAADDGIDVGAVDADAAATWGVFAAEGADTRVTATPAADGGWMLRGTKPWCSLAGRLSHALLTAWTSADRRRLFALRLDAPGVRARPGPWVARGLAAVVSAPIDLDDVRAVPVGDDGWYLRRDGFAAGGMGVAAVWWGGALPLVDALVEAAARSGADQLAAVALGEADAAMWAARAVLADAADAIDGGIAGDAAVVLAERVRAAASNAAERVLAIAAHALGPAPLAADDAYARRVADLGMYLRQHHGARDLARLGRRVVAS